MKLKDILKPKINRANGQISLDIRKKKFEKAKINLQDFLESDIDIFHKLKDEEFD